MGRMCCAFLLATGLWAGETEIGLLLDRTVPKERSFASVPFKPEPAQGAAIRLGFSPWIADWGPAQLQFTLAYHPKSESALKIAHSDTGLKLGSEYFAAGAQFNWRTFVAFSFGLEYRSEKLRVAGNLASLSPEPTLVAETQFNRPWAKIHFGLAVPTPFLKPFVGLEMAAPLVNMNEMDTAENRLRSLAPSFQVGLYGGVRF